MFNQEATESEVNLSNVKIEAAENSQNLKASRMIEKLQTELAKSQATVSRLEQTNIDQFKQFEASLKEVKNQQTSKCNQLQTQLTKSQEMSAKLEQSNKDLLAHIASNQNKIKQLEATNKSLEDDKRALQDQLRKANQQNLTLTTRLEKGILSLRTVLEQDFAGAYIH